MCHRLTALAVALLSVGLSGATWAQEPVKPAGTARAGSGKFLGLEVFGGAALYDTKDQSGTGDGEPTDPGRYEGWDVGASFNPGVRWMGLTGTVGRHNTPGVPTFHVLAGPRFYIGNAGARWIAHILGGIARTSGAAPRSSGELVLGGGLDLFCLRMQFDYVRLNLQGLPKNNQRAFVGLYLPLCFRSCKEGVYEVDLSGSPTVR
jgi:hypothetical protein